MNDKNYEMIGESIWDTYRRMASLLAETEEEKPTQRRPPTREELMAAGGPVDPAYGHKRAKPVKVGEAGRTHTPRRPSTPGPRRTGQR